MANERGDGERWAAALVKHIGAAMKRARAGGRTAAWLSNRTEELGYKISPTVIAKLDTGHRGGILGVAELLVLAAALDVPPLSLIFPDVTKRFEALPGRYMDGVEALGWFIGDGDSATYINTGSDVSFDRWYVPEDVGTNSSMRIPLRLLEIDKEEAGLHETRNRARRDEETRDHLIDALSQTIQALQAERDRLLAVYQKSLPDA